MTTVIDERVVEMRFNNQDFEKNVAQSMSTLEKLKESLNFDSAKSLADIGKAANNVNMDGLNTAVETVQTKFSALQIIGITALSEITKAAMNAGTSLVKSLISPITEGGMRRAMNIEQAKFQLDGLGVAWEKIGDDINYAVDGTAYGLDVAAKAASQLTASGVQTGDEMKKALRGISGVAAMTGREYEDISRIFTTVAGNGRVMASELNRIGERGLNAKAALATFFNGVNDGSIEASATVTSAISSMTKGIKVSESDISEFVKKGLVDFEIFASAMDSAFGDHAKDANKTFSGALSNMKAALSRIGADFATPYMESMKNIYNSARVMFNGVRKALQPLVGDYEWVLKLLEKGVTNILDNKDFNSGLAHIVETVRYAFWDLYTVVKPIGDAIKQIFPVDAMAMFERATKKIADFTKTLYLSKTDMENLKDTFAGIFSVFKLFGTVVTEVLKAIFPMTAGFDTINSVVLALTGALGRVVTKLVEFIDKSKIIQTIVGTIKTILTVLAKIVLVPIGLAIAGILEVITLIVKLVSYIGDLIKNSTILQNIIQKLQMFFKDFIDTLKILAGTVIGAIVLGIYSLITGAVELAKYLKEVVTSSEKLKNMMTFLGDRVNAAKEGFANLVTYLKDLAMSSPIMQSIITKFEELNNQTRDTSTFVEVLGNVVKTVGTVIAGIGVVIVAALAKTIEFISNFVRSVIVKFNELSGNATTAFGKLVNVIKAIGSTIADFIKHSGIANFLNNIVKNNEGSIGFFERAKAVLKAFFEEFTIGHAIALAFVGIMTAVGLSFIKLAKTASGAIGNIGGLFKDLRNKLFGGKKERTVLDNLQQLAISIALIAGSLALLASVDPSNLKLATGIIAGLVIGLTALTGIMTAVSVILQKKGLTDNMLSYAKSVLTLSVAIGVLAASLKVIESIDVSGNKLIEMFMKIGMVLGSMAALVLIMNKLAGSAPKAAVDSLAIVAAASALFILVNTLKKLEGIKLEGIEEGLLAMIPIFVAMIALVAAGGNFNVSAGAGFALACLGLNKVLPTIVKTMQALAEADLSGLKSKIENNKAIVIGGVAAICAILISLGKASETFKAISRIFLSLAALSVAIAASTAILSGVFKDLTEFFDGLEEGNKSWIKAGATIGVMVTVLGLFTILFGVFAKMNIEKAASKLLSFSVFLLAFSGSLVIMAEVIKKLENVSATGIVKGIAVIGFLSILVSRMINTSEAAEKGNIKALVAMMASMTVLMGELIVLSVLPFEKLLAAAISMAAVMWGLSKVIDAVGNINTEHSIKKLAMLITATGSIILIGQTLSHIAQYPWSSIAAAGGALSAAFMAVALGLKIISSVDFDLGMLGTAVTGVALLVPLGLVLSELAKNDWDKIAAAGGAMGGAFLLISAAMLIFSKTKFDVGLLGTALAAVMIMVPLGIMLMELSKCDWLNIAVAAGSMGGAFVLIAVAMKVFSTIKFNPGMIGNALVAVMLLVSVGAALAIVAQQDWRSILAAGGIMSAALLVVSASLAILAKIGGMDTIAAAAAILAVSVSLIGLATAIKMFESINADALTKAGIAFGVMVGVLSALAIISALTGGVLEAALLGVALALDLTAAAMLVFGAGLDLVGLGLAIMGPALQVIEGIDLLKISEGFMELAKGLGLVTLAGVALSVAIIPMGLIAVEVAALGLALMVANPAMERFAALDFTTVAQSCGVLAESGKGLIVGAVGIAAAGAALVILGAGLGTASTALLTFNAALSVFISVLGTAKTTASNTANSIKTSVVKPFQDMVAKVKGFVGDFKTALASGFRDGEKEASTGGTKIAKALLNPFHTVLGWHSPPKFLTDLFSDICKAISNGGADASKQAGKEGSGIAQSLMTSLTNAFSGFDLQGIIGGLLDGIGIKIDLTSLKLNSLNNAKVKNSRSSKQLKQDDLVLGEVEKTLAAEAAKEKDAVDELSLSLDNNAKSAGGASSAQKDFAESLAETLESQLDMFSKFEAKTELTAEELLANMQSNLDGFASWTVKLSSLAERGIDQALYQKLAEMGPKGYETVNAFCMMTDDQLQQANQMWQTSIAIPEAFAGQIKKSYDNLGADMQKGYINGINAEQANATKATKEAFLKQPEEAKDALGEKSPSKKTYQMGLWFVQGLENGIKENIPLATIQAWSLATNVINKLNSTLRPSVSYETGNQFIQGLINGMNSKRVDATETAGSIARDVIDRFSGVFIESAQGVYDAAYAVGEQAMAGLHSGIEEHSEGPLSKARSVAESIGSIIANALQVESPSKVTTRIGKFVSLGLAVGIEDGASNVIKACERLSEDTTDMLGGSVTTLQDAINSQFDFNPVITPVLDLSFIRAQMAEVNSLFGNRGIGINDLDGQNGGNINGQPTQINYTQNNYSPKALSRYEIYRDTRYQLSQLKGAMR